MATTGYIRNKNIASLLTKFRLRLNGAHYIHVYIWDSFDAMKENVDLRASQPPAKHDIVACFLELPVVTVDGLECLPLKFGEVHLVSGFYGAGVVAHELMHCMLCWIRDTGDEDDDEIYATMAGELTRQFWNRHYAWREEVDEPYSSASEKAS
jgi:hypothetical protein